MVVRIVRLDMDCFEVVHKVLVCRLTFVNNGFRFSALSDKSRYKRGVQVILKSTINDRKNITTYIMITYLV